MVDDLNSLEREVERDLARWTRRLDVAPPDEVIQSVRAAVQVELQAAWMAAESARAGLRRGRRLRRWLSAQATGSVGAAAMLALCIGVIWYAGTLSSSAGSSDVEMLLAAMPDDPLLAEVQSLADDLGEDPVFLIDDDEESLGDLVREMDQLLDERSSTRDTSQLGVKRAGAVG